MAKEPPREPLDDELRAICVPMKLDAFVFNEAVCQGKSSIAPLSKPEYHDFATAIAPPKHDVIPPLDLSLASPAYANPRLYDLTTGRPRTSRFGIYLSWCIPRPFRQGAAATASASSRSDAGPSRGVPRVANEGDATVPQYVAVPNRWIVVRQLSQLKSEDGSSQNSTNRVFVVESDLLRRSADFKITEDVENEVSPFLDPILPLNEQGDTFLGFTTSDMDAYVKRVEDYHRRDGGASGPTPVRPELKRQIPLTVLGSSNPLFADYQPHHAGVFSIHDDLSDVLSHPGASRSTNVSYFVFGYYSTEAASVGPHDPLTAFGRVGQEIQGMDLLAAFNMRLQKPKDVKNTYVTTEMRRNRQVGAWIKRPKSAEVFTVCHGALYGVEYNHDTAPKINPAELAMEALNTYNPISVGTTSMDALLAHVRIMTAHLPPELQNKAAYSLINKVQCYLAQPSDDVDSQLEAADLIDTHNFKPSSTGTRWHLKQDKSGAKDQPPNLSDIPLIIDVNQRQAFKDQLEREHGHLQHLLFCTYWKALSLKASLDFSGSLPDGTKQTISRSVVDLVQRIREINLLTNTKLKDVAGDAASKLESSAGTPYYQQKDPVVAFLGLPTGWPSGWDEPVGVRVRRMEREPSTVKPEERDLRPTMYGLDKIEVDMFHFLANELEGKVAKIDEQLIDTMVPPRQSSDRSFRLAELGFVMSLACGPPDNYSYHPLAKFDMRPQFDVNCGLVESDAVDFAFRYASIYLPVEYLMPGIKQNWPIMVSYFQKILQNFTGFLRISQLAGRPIHLTPQRVKELQDQSRPDRLPLYHNFLETIGNQSLPIDKQFDNFGTDWIFSDDAILDFGPSWMKLDPRMAVDPYDLSKRLYLLRDGNNPGAAKSELASNIKKAFAGVSSREVKHVFQDLFMEWMCLRTAQNFCRDTPAYFLDQDRWFSQAWFPIFVEWELEYYHIPFSQWTFGPAGKDQRVKYSIRSDVDLRNTAEDDIDVHIVSGRSLVLPSVASQLKAVIKRFVDTINPNNLSKEGLSEKDLDDMWEALNRLPFLSAALTGLNNHLVTLQTGNHLKPFSRASDRSSSAATGASKEVTDLGFDDDVIKLMGSKTARTPFAEFQGGRSSKFSAFKPVTHGQARFTKLTIADKFGQAVPCLDPTHRPNQPNDALDLVLSEYMFCETRKGSDGKIRPNTIHSQPEARCEFFQIPPKINQDARWNAHHLIPDSYSGSWRPVSEWENPIVCIIVINYIDKSLQIFDVGGTFVAEYAVGSETGGSGVRCRPFKPKPATNAAMAEFMTRLAQRPYLQEVYAMIEHAVGNLPHAPTTYADALPAVLGRPVVLTYMGWSLELAEPAYRSHAFSDDGSAVPSVLDYPFPLKLGDKDASYDGLIGYCPITHRSSDAVTSSDWAQIITHFGVSKDSKVLVPAPAACSSTFKPYYVQAEASSTPDTIAASHNNALVLYAVFADAFTPIWGYSGILPTKQLKLPAWTIERALKRMTGFYALGPLLVPDDVLPATDKNTPAKDIPAEELRTIQVPSDGVHDLAWLQPSYDHGAQTFGYDEGAGADGKTFYEVMGLGQSDSLFGQREGPLTAVEGFLQLAKKKDVKTT